MVTNDKPKLVFNDVLFHNPIKFQSSKIRYNGQKSSMYRQKRNKAESGLLATRPEFAALCNTTEYLENYWCRYERLALDMSMDDMLVKYIGKYAKSLIKLHPDQCLSVADKEIYSLTYVRTVADLKIQWYQSKAIRSRVPRNYFSSMLLAVCKDHSVIIQSAFAAKILNDKIFCTRLCIDGTFAKIYGAKEPIYPHQIFYSVLIRSPSIERTSKLLTLGCVYTCGKKKTNYTDIATWICNANKDKYEVDCSHIKQMCTDMEYSLFTEFNECWLKDADVLFCFFHVMQAWMKNLNVKFCVTVGV